MDTKAAKNERIGVSPEKFVCKLGYNPVEGCAKCLGWGGFPEEEPCRSGTGAGNGWRAAGEERVWSRSRSARRGKRTSIVCSS